MRMVAATKCSQTSGEPHHGRQGYAAACAFDASAILQNLNGSTTMSTLAWQLSAASMLGSAPLSAHDAAVGRLWALDLLRGIRESDTRLGRIERRVHSVHSVRRSNTVSEASQASQHAGGG